MEWSCEPVEITVKYRKALHRETIELRSILTKPISKTLGTLCAAFLAFNGTALESQKAFGSPIMGDVAAVQATPVGASQNPGNFGFVSSTQIEGEGGIKQSTARFRVPGAEAMTKSTTGLTLGALPSYVYKLTPDIGGNVIGFALPTTVKAGLDDVPLLLLDQINRVDIAATIKSVTFLQTGAGIKIRDRFGVGGALTFTQASGGIDINASGSSSTLAKVEFSGLTSVNVRVGTRIEVVPGKFAVGVATNLFYSTKVDKMSIESPLADALSDGAGGGPTNAPDDLKKLLGTKSGGIDRILFGGGAALGPLQAFSDFEYKRKPEKQEIFSISKLKTAPGDYHDSLSFKGGGKLKLPKFLAPRGGAAALIGGVSYAQSEVGPGEAGDDGKAGFSPLMLVASNFSSGLLSMVGDLNGVLPIGFGATPPFWSVSGGFELQEYKIRTRNKSAPRHHLAVTGGAFYRVESIGVDETGDHPFAFEKKVIGLSGSLIYRF
jgi:hypothetical protein